MYSVILGFLLNYVAIIIGEIILANQFALVPKLLVIPITVALVAETPRIAHPIRMLTLCGSCFSATETVALFTHAFRVMGEVSVAAICNDFEVSSLSLELTTIDSSLFALRISVIQSFYTLQIDINIDIVLHQDTLVFRI